MAKRRQGYSPAQTSFIDEIIVDNFAGGGGCEMSKREFFSGFFLGGMAVNLIWVLALAGVLL